MLTENTFVVANVQDTDYSSFLDLLGQHCGKPFTFMPCDGFIEHVETLCSAGQFPENNILVIFCESNFLPVLSEYLGSNLNPTNYILVAFCHKNCLLLSNYDNVFDFINTSFEDFNMAFFFNRLRMDINNKNRMTLLQFELRKFYEIGKSLSSEKDALKLLEMIIDSSMSMTSSDAGTIYLIVDKGTGNWSSIKDKNIPDKLLKFVIAKNMSMDIRLEAFTSEITTTSIFGYTAFSGKSLRIDNAYKIPRNVDYKHNKSFDMKSGYVTRSILSTPMKDHENNVMGVIQLINKKQSKNMILDYTNSASVDSIVPYDYTDELIMNSLAGQAAVVLENSLLYRDMQELLLSYKEQNNQLTFLSTKVIKAHEEERKRIARDIHDGPAQSSVNLSLKVELCKKYFQNGSHEKLVSEMNTLSGAIRDTVKEIRTIIYDLKPSYLDDGLIAALKNRLDVFMENSGIGVTFNVTGVDSRVEYYMTSTLYKIVQETLSNILKHAHAQKVEVDLDIFDREILLTVTDDGMGFDTVKLKSKNRRSLTGGFGLEGIRERVELIRGTMVIDSEPGHGTSIRIRVPIV